MSLLLAAILTAMVGKSSLDPASNQDLSDLDGNLLAEAVAELEEADLSSTRLTPKQVEAIFAALDTTNKLKRLDITMNDLSPVDPEVMARVINKLEMVSMLFARLTEQQITRILEQSLVSTSLKRLELHGVDEVDSELYNKAEQVIPNLYIDEF